MIDVYHRQRMTNNILREQNGDLIKKPKYWRISNLSLEMIKQYSDRFQKFVKLDEDTFRNKIMSMLNKKTKYSYQWFNK